jgi:hypothetical protein
MSWNEHHSRSEKLVAEAESLRHAGEHERAGEIYCNAAKEEALAFDALSVEKVRTRGITAVSAIALFYKGHDYASAEKTAYHCLTAGSLPGFAEAEIRNLLQIIWTTSSAEKAGVRFVAGDVLVSVKGGQVIHGGAPLELIVRKVEGIQAVLFRTVEMLLDRPFRRRGEPAGDVQSMFRPWLFQAPAGSYQFAVRMQEPEQMQLWNENRPKLERVTETFFQVLRASANDPDKELTNLVPDAQYRAAFLNLTRNLSPSGKTFERLEVRDASAPGEPLVTLGLETRTGLNGAIRKLKPSLAAQAEDEPTTIAGTLRALHLDQDWLEISKAGDPIEHIRVEDAGDALDDVVGPMVNRQVVVSAIKRGTKYLYRDIELSE